MNTCAIVGLHTHTHTACPPGEKECVLASSPSSSTPHHLEYVLSLTLLLTVVICLCVLYLRHHHAMLGQEHPCSGNPTWKDQGQTHPRKHLPNDLLFPT